MTGPGRLNEEGEGEGEAEAEGEGEAGAGARPEARLEVMSSHRQVNHREAVRLHPSGSLVGAS